MSTQVHVHVHVRQHVHGISYHVHVAKVRGPQFNPGWLPGFHSSLKAFPHVHVLQSLLDQNKARKQRGNTQEIMRHWDLQTSAVMASHSLYMYMCL